MNLIKTLFIKNSRLFISTILVIIASNIITLTWNFYLSTFINQMTAGKIYLLKTIPIFLMFIFLMIITNYFVTYLSGYFFETINHKLRMGFVRYLLSLKFKDTESINSGEQMSLMQNEIGEISTYIGNNLADLINTVLSFVLTLVFLIFQSPLLTLVITLPVLITLIYVVFSSKIIGKYAEIAQNKKQVMTGMVSSAVNAAPVLNLYDCGNMICGKHDETANSWAKASIKEEKTRAKLMSLSAVLSNIPFLLLLLVGGLLVIKGSLTIGVVYIFINLSNHISMPLMNMPGIIAGYRRFIVNLKRMEVQRCDVK